MSRKSIESIQDNLDLDVAHGNERGGDIWIRIIKTLAGLK